MHSKRNLKLSNYIFLVKIKFVFPHLKGKIYRSYIVEIICLCCLINSFLYYSSMEHTNNDLHYECVIHCQVTSDLNKDKTIAFLQTELDILRASHKKVPYKNT